MAEYIERAAAVKSVLRMRRPENSVAQNRMLSIIQMDMLKLPAADVVPVVRCRDCKWHDIDYCMLYGFGCTGDHYCKSWAEKEKEPCKNIETIDENGLTDSDKERVTHLPISPCPKCGSPADLCCERVGMEPLPFFSVKCTDKQCVNHDADYITDTPEDAVKQWNEYAAPAGKEEG